MADNRNQLAGRRAVAAHKQRVHVSRMTFGGDFQSAEVVVDGQVFEVGSHVLGALRAGFTPEELGLEPVTDT